MLSIRNIYLNHVTQTVRRCEWNLQTCLEMGPMANCMIAADLLPYSCSQKMENLILLTKYHGQWLAFYIVFRRSWVKFLPSKSYILLIMVFGVFLSPFRQILKVSSRLFPVHHSRSLSHLTCSWGSIFKWTKKLFIFNSVCKYNINI
jgi:hypothetical protein